MIKCINIFHYIILNRIHSSTSPSRRILPLVEYLLSESISKVILIYPIDYNKSADYELLNSSINALGAVISKEYYVNETDIEHIDLTISSAILICPPSVCLMHDAWLALVAGCFGQTGYVDEPLYLYRQHKANTLGAEKGDSMEGAKARIKDGSQAAENYRRMFGQAESLLELYKDKLTQEQKETLDAFISLPRQTRTGKIKSIWKYGFTKNTWLRTLGQMLFIGD